MAEDEAATLDDMTRLRREVLEPCLSAHGGRLFKTLGDGFLAEFRSAVEAVRCAMAIQAALAAGRVGLTLRIAVHQGDVAVAEDGSDLLGDGVNVAVRLEALALPGGIAVSARVREDLAGRLPVEAEDMGEQALKNVPQRVRVFRLRGSAPGETPATGRPPALALPDRPSLVVLPFQNMSGDPSQEYLADGLVEDVTTALSRIRWLFVIARNSAFTYKGRAVDVRQVGRELGVRYVVEGSVRVQRAAAGQRVRVTAQLIDAASGEHLWADRIDRDLEDIFAVQDEITGSIAASIEPHLHAREEHRARASPPGSLDAWGKVVRALSLVFRISRDANEQAQLLAAEAAALDPDYARAHAVGGWATMWSAHCHWAADGAAAYRKARQMAERAIVLDPGEPWARTTLGHILSGEGAHAAALVELESALAINPNFALARTIHGWALLRAGRMEAAVEETGKALRMSPIDGFAGFYASIHGLALLGSGRFEAALPHIRRSTAAFPEFIGNWRLLASCCGHLDLVEEARDALARADALGGTQTLSAVYRHLGPHAHRDVFVEGLRRAGMPE